MTDSMENDEKYLQLCESFGKDLEQLFQHWSRSAGPEPAAADQLRIQVAAVVALGARYGYTKAVVGKVLPRHILLGLDKQVQKMGRAFLSRDADGQPGLREVK